MSGHTRAAVLYSLLTVALTSVGTGQVISQNPSKTTTEQEVETVEGERDQALQQRNTAVLDRIYADDLVFVNTRGQLFTKAQRLADVGSGKVEYSSYSQGSYGYQVYGNTVIMTGVTRSVVTFQGRINRIPRRFTNVYIKLNGQWKLVAHQATPFAEQ